MHQLKFKPTRHQAGAGSSLLDIFFSNIPERVSNIENFVNTLSEHEGVKCIVNMKTGIRTNTSFLLRNYRDCSFNILQPLVDVNHNLQLLFSDLDPEVIANKLLNGLQEITDLTMKKKSVQTRARGVPYWSASLEDERKRVTELNKTALETKDSKDSRAYKHAKIIHSRNIEKHKKQKIKESLSGVKSRWKTMKELTSEEDLVPKIIKYKGSTITLPKEIATRYGEFLEEKTEAIREEISFTIFKVIQVFKKVVRRIDEPVRFSQVTIKEIGENVKKIKNSNLRGNSELTNKIIKTLREYMSVAFSYLVKRIFATGSYPSALKTSRNLLLKKKGKPDDSFNSY